MKTSSKIRNEKLKTSKIPEISGRAQDKESAYIYDAKIKVTGAYTLNRKC